MKKILIAAHGKFAEGIRSSAEIILGKQENLYTINAYLDETPVKQQLDEFFKGVDLEKDTLLVITDVFGGSVNQAIISNYQKDNIKVITGVNLPLLLELIMLDEEDVTDDKIRSIVNKAREQVILVNDALSKATGDDFDF
ncbi:MAG: PTS sugar transporter subunit IIA [Tepidanaerobacter acetatoxydans]|uniref:PTS sugar transporter subunit IIA n=1 Tax=Tepidanaerobacter acetatoxydans TaxID=499229 RepID=UPI0026F116A5|nr:PTS sugar transporter subunit IIA [Tepidanaerobacter acetatoxydans]NLU09509.1 PTS sugar transporter subunit IIA [Tepidanaerobacter acetatoxydans]